jgi:hypothetical protein
MRSFLPQALYTVWCLSKLYIYINICKTTYISKKKTLIVTNAFNTGLLAISQFASGMFCDRPIRSRFPMGFLGSRANVELVPKFHAALHASHAALPMVTLKVSP